MSKDQFQIVDTHLVGPFDVYEDYNDGLHIIDATTRIVLSDSYAYDDSREKRVRRMEIIAAALNREFEPHGEPSDGWVLESEVLVWRERYNRCAQTVYELRGGVTTPQAAPAAPAWETPGERKQRRAVDGDLAQVIYQLAFAVSSLVERIRGPIEREVGIEMANAMAERSLQISGSARMIVDRLLGQRP